MNHLHIHAANVATSQKFYETYFGFRKAFDHDGGAVFLKDASGFLLAIFPTQPGESTELPGWFHVGFCWKDPAQVRALFQRMSEDGVRFSKPLAEYPGAVAFYCLDPDGYKVEVSWNEGE